MPNSVQRGVQPSSAPERDTDAAPADLAGTSVDRALWLLQLMGEHQVLRVAEAAELLGVARSTAHRLLTALRRRGFVLQDRPNGAYRAGPALYEIALAAVNRIDIRQVARPVLEELRAETQETVSLAVLEGATVRFLDCAESQRIVRVGNRTGVVRPAHAAAVGKAILAGLSEAELSRRYPDGELPSGTTAATIADLSVLREELAEIRDRGYALNWEESTDGVCAIAVALRDTVGQPLAALGVVAPVSRMVDVEGIRALAPAVLRGAALIEERLRDPS
ncbi:IclR family transcriptional regulator [Modestobacter sp. VKM Ac-2986]|uniref:IclR family transcriptional regulator n=1 Tax=Modestobacter sp. VKM Ac-2986 TaxID=3004140 RepID=UPI0022AA3DDF|nr:IclR family transcriptional regulator [Modestobacter sp. VKM Ac-2986]MCZ2827562.1 IclR family transcriptional regulator [Modestobacter sp. VKM Ac-2986]